jgi:hypothetical protein
MKAVEIGRHGQHDARCRLVRFSTELLNQYFQTRPQIWQEQSYLYNELSSLSAGWGGRDRTSEWRNQNPLPYRLATPQQAEPERERTMPRASRFGQRPVYRGCQAISTGWNPEFRPKSAPGSVDPL